MAGGLGRRTGKYRTGNIAKDGNGRDTERPAMEAEVQHSRVQQLLQLRAGE